MYLQPHVYLITLSFIYFTFSIAIIKLTFMVAQLSHIVRVLGPNTVFVISLSSPITLANKELPKKDAIPSCLCIVLISILCSLVGSLMWLSAQDITELVLRIGMPYSIWSMWSKSGFYDYLIFNILFRSGPLFVWSFIYYGYKLISDLGIEKNKYQETLLLAKEAQLQMLRYQINPHFLFNSLNSIQALMYKDTPLADDMLAEFSEFLRYTLKNKDEIYVPLEDEIEMISKYLYIEKIRFQDKLNYKIEMSDDTRKIKILSFLLQPFVENAIKYGMKCKQDVLSIDIQSYKHNNWLVITVENTGKWDNKDIRKGIGIENVKNRLENAYPEKHILRIIEENNRVKIKLQLNFINE